MYWFYLNETPRDEKQHNARKLLLPDGSEINLVLSRSSVGVARLGLEVARNVLIKPYVDQRVLLWNQEYKTKNNKGRPIRRGSP